MPISVRLPDNILKRLDFLARQTGRTRTFYILEALNAHLDNLETYYLAADVLERIRKGEEEVSTADDVRDELGLED